MMSGVPTEWLVARYFSGTDDEDRLNASIANTWREALTEPGERAEIGRALGADPDALDPDIPPYHAQTSGSGLIGAEVLIAVGTAFVLGWAKGFGEEAGKATAERLKDLWDTYFRNKVSPSGSGKLGAEKASSDNQNG